MKTQNAKTKDSVLTLKKYLIFLCLVSVGSISAQKNKINATYSNSTSSNISLRLDSDKMEFEVSATRQTSSVVDDILITDMYLQGDISCQNGYIVCTEKMSNKKYRLKVLGEDLLANYDIPLLEDTLYAIIRRLPNKENMTRFGHWENGKKHGYWHYVNAYNPSPSSILIIKQIEPYYKLYKEGQLIETKIIDN